MPSLLREGGFAVGKDGRVRPTKTITVGAPIGRPPTNPTQLNVKSTTYCDIAKLKADSEVKKFEKAYAERSDFSACHFNSFYDMFCVTALLYLLFRGGQKNGYGASEARVCRIH